MTFNAEAVLLEKLELIKAEPKNPRRGICGMVDVHTWDRSDYSVEQSVIIDRVLKSLFIKWPDYSGDIGFPVQPHSKKDNDAFDAFHRYKNLWGSHAYGRKRRELLDWCINELKRLNQ